MNATILGDGFPCKPASSVTSHDFFFDGLKNEGNAKNSLGSSVTKGNVMAFPGLNTQGISMNRIDIDIGGINPPHSHPRAAEIGVVIQGHVKVGLITTENLEYSRLMLPGQIYVVPRGLVHFQLNVGQDKAFIVSAFNSHMPRTYVDGVDLFCAKPFVPYDVLTKTFHSDQSVLDNIYKAFPDSKCSSFSSVG
ncbi:hypothetical protein BUALT_Bualt02G0147200 [Buddleja alternifolia]|uniref:Germin-like protein n=1 Tax=Buddleja alternifolia TaxID=168488 RepID=A0AAV6Y2D8_9LAMI|nr:hypothetical protein BUALT_Bualt02G0147200 [Buddleja alternifolia]